MRLVWCGLYDGAAYLSTSESYLRDLGVVRLIPRAAYSPEITVLPFSQGSRPSYNTTWEEAVWGCTIKGYNFFSYKYHVMNHKGN